MKLTIKGKTVKSLSNTRWSARLDATTALKENFAELRQLSQDFTLDDNETNETKLDSFFLKKSMDALETAIICVLWHKILQRFHSTSKCLQRSDMSLGSCVALYNGIESFCQHLRDKFDTIKKDGLKLTTGIQKTYASPNKRNRKTKRTFGYKGEDTGCTRALEDARESFRIGTYLSIIDSLIAEVIRPKSAYCILQQNFNFLPNLNTWGISDIENAASKLLKVYASDLDSDFLSEVVHFAFHLRSSPDLGSKTNTAQAQLSYLKKNCLIETFPNAAIILRIYLTFPVANTEGERSFSALKRVKNYLRSSLTQDCVCDFCIMAIEKSFTKSMSFENTIDKFCSSEMPKSPVVTHYFP